MTDVPSQYNGKYGRDNGLEGEEYDDISGYYFYASTILG